MKQQTSKTIKPLLVRGMFIWLLTLGICEVRFALAEQNSKQGIASVTKVNRGSMLFTNALPANVIIVTNTNDSGPGSLRDALAQNGGDTIDATGVSGTILLTSGALQITH